MTKKMLIDATHPEETRVAVVNGNRLEQYDYETVVRKQLKSNIYLVKVTRVEPSLQAAFVDFGGNRHGFLPFPEIHPDYYRIPIADREALLAEERAWAVAQAAREEEEDEDETEDDEDDAPEQPEDVVTIEDTEDDGEEDEAYEPRHTGSIAAEIAAESVTDDEDDEDDEEEGEETSEAESEEEEDGEDEDEDDEDDDEENPAAGKRGVRNVGGDSVDQPVFRSSIKRRYKIQEVIKRNQIMLIQINKEERGNKGAAVTTYISLPGRYCVLMPNSPRGGGVSRKVSNSKDRQHLRKVLRELNVPEGMSVILRTAGVTRSTAEIKRDLDYLLRLWDEIRGLTLKSTAPALIYEEGNIVKRAIRDLYRRDISEILVAGDDAFENAQNFMKMLMPSSTDKVIRYDDAAAPLFARYQVETQIDAIHTPTVHLKSGGYIVINPTEALVSIDVNSGRATKGRHIEETALKTNLEAADEIARQLRLRDLGGLVVVDFIDMEDRRGNRIVERRMREAMSDDRARIQLGRISAFGLMELSRQRLNPSLVETNYEICQQCNGVGIVRTVETSAIMLLRAIEAEAAKGRAGEIRVSAAAETAIYVFNHKRGMLAAIEQRHGVSVYIHADDDMVKPQYKIESVRGGDRKDTRPSRHAPVQGVDMSDYSGEDGGENTASFNDEDGDGNGDGNSRDDRNGRDGRGRNRRSRGGRGRNRGGRNRHDEERGSGNAGDDSSGGDAGQDGKQDDRNRDGGHDGGREGGGRRRGRRGGRRRGGRGRNRDNAASDNNSESDSSAPAHDNTPREDRNNQAASRASASSGTEAAFTHRKPESASPPPAAAVGDDSGPSGGNRKGWWKRLTE